MTDKRRRRPSTKPTVDTNELALCIHTALRKGVDHATAAPAWSALQECAVWGDAVRIGCEWAGLSRHVRLRSAAEDAAVPLYRGQPRKGTAPLGLRPARDATEARETARDEIVVLTMQLTKAVREVHHLRAKLKLIRDAVGPDPEEKDRHDR